MPKHQAAEPGEAPAQPQAVTSRDASGAADLPVFGGPRAVEVGGREGPEPTRYGDWEKNGRCIDF